MEWHIEHVDACESTQDLLMERAAAGAPEGTVVVAARMEGGRGTHGRPWHAPEGGLYLSLLLRDAVDVQRLTLAIANAVADVLEVAGVDPGLKWVNDVLVDGKKIAGILVEAESTGDTIDAVAIGIGINVNGSAADWPHPFNQAITLEEALGGEACIPDLESYLLETIDAWLVRLRDEPEAVIAAWSARDALLGQTIGFDPDGDLCAKVHGTVKGIDDQGRLLLDVDGQEQAYAAGTIV